MPNLSLTLQFISFVCDAWFSCYVIAVDVADADGNDSNDGNALRLIKRSS